MDNELLYKIGITGTESETELLGKLKVALAETTRQINELTKAGKENSRTLNEAVGQELKNQKELQAEIRKVLDIKKIEAAETKRIAAEKSAIIEQARKEAIAELNQRNAIAEANKIEATSIVGMRREALLLTKQMELLNQADRDNINVGGQMRNRIVELDRAIKLHEQSIGNYRRSVGQYNTAGMAMSQVLREIPAFTFSAQTGFLALSNNLPILGDEMKKIANRIDEVTGKKVGWTTAFVEMAKTAVSFGGIMTVIIGLLPTLVGWLTRKKQADNEAAESQKEHNETMERWNELLELRFSEVNDSKLRSFNEVFEALTTNANKSTLSTKDLTDALYVLNNRIEALRVRKTNIGGVNVILPEDEALFNNEKNRLLKFRETLENEISERSGEAEKKRKADRDKKAKEREDKMKSDHEELLALIEQYHGMQIDKETNKNSKLLQQEVEKHHKIIDELKVESDDTQAIIKQKNLNVEAEMERHYREVIRIALIAKSEQDKNGLVQPIPFDNAKFQQQLNQLNRDKANQIKKENEANERILATQTIQIAQQTAERIAEIKQDAVERQLQRELTAIERNAEGQNAILENRLRNGLITEGQYNDEKQRLNQETARLELEANKKSFDKNKEMSIQLALINGALALIAVMANSKDPTGIYTAIQLGATATATGLQIQQIRATEYAELGGKINGKSHAQGGVLVEAEGDEMIINKKAGRSNQIMSAVGTPSQIASAINSTYGGVSWETTSLTNKPSPNIFSNNTSSEYITFAQMEQLIIRQANMINDKEVFMVESKVTKSQNKVKMYEKNGKF